MIRVGVFGGTFDPPHIGHLILAAEGLVQLNLDRLLWVLTPDPPHKQGRSISPLDVRLELLYAALADNPAFELSRVDIDRPAPHYALDTLRLLAEAYPAADLVYLIGGDSLRDLPAWHRPLELLAAVHSLGVMRRPGAKVDLSTLEQQLPGITAKVSFYEAPLLEISSSEIRRNIATGSHFRYYLPPAVYRLIQEQGLYRAPTD